MRERRITLATRPSDLARWQTRWVQRALTEAWPGIEVDIKVIVTRGDRELDRPLPEIGGKGLFTLELEQALLSGEVDGAVHSLKDLPVENPPGLVVGAIPSRADARDVLITASSCTLDELSPGSRVGTSSLRRQAQVLARRPDLKIISLRGNVNTRVEKVYRDDLEYDGIVLAAAGVQRLKLEDHIGEYLPLEVMVPAPAQGALAVQCRAEDRGVLEKFQAIDQPDIRRAVTAERGFLDSLGGGCAIPVGAHGEIEPGTGLIFLTGVVADVQGGKVIRVTGRGEDPAGLGDELAQRAKDQGAMELIDV